MFTHLGANSVSFLIMQSTFSTTNSTRYSLHLDFLDDQLDILSGHSSVVRFPECDVHHLRYEGRRTCHRPALLLSMQTSSGSTIIAT
mmetsp:Transcript_7738/g.10967  ORF Transcript_7738/g.10967 Transcript_7738/m.10967 type:complete len:87 (+) Transcript_7738:258-518(+)